MPSRETELGYVYLVGLPVHSKPCAYVHLCLFLDLPICMDMFKTLSLYGYL